MLMCYGATVCRAEEPIDIVPDDTAALKELLGACDSALNEGKNVIALKDRETAYLERHINQLEERNAQLEANKNSESNRAIWWFVGGMLVTGLTFKLTR